MKCYYCDQDMDSGSAKFDTWGDRTVCAHRQCDRDALAARARELGVLTDASWPGQRPQNHSEQVIIEAIAAEKLSGEWLERLEKLPTDEAKREAVHRLRLEFDRTRTNAAVDGSNQ